MTTPKARTFTVTVRMNAKADQWTLADALHEMAEKIEFIDMKSVGTSGKFVAEGLPVKWVARNASPALLRTESYRRKRGWSGGK